MNQPLVIGIGNPDRADDGVGWQVARTLEGVTDTALSHGDPAHLLDLWEGRDAVILVDAVVTGGRPGSLTVLDLTDHDPPAGVGSSTHDLGPGMAVALGRALGRLPHTLLLVGVEAADFTPGSSPAGGTATGAHRAVELINAWCSRTGTRPE